MQPSTCRFGTPEYQGSIMFGIVFNKGLLYSPNPIDTLWKLNFQKKELVTHSPFPAPRIPRFLVTIAIARWLLGGPLGGWICS